MKNIRTYSFLASLILMIVGVFKSSEVSAQGYDDVTFDDFYYELDPYGDWDNDPEYGNVWYPDVERDFRPYGTNGYWSMTEYGNTWVSNYDWGWAPFHYGRWVHSSRRGWGWVPGYEWGPGWVSWRSGGGYYGWAPMAPGISVNVSFNLPIDLWVFIPTARIYDPYMHRHWSYGSRYRNIYNRTTVINNTYIVNNHHYYSGPSRRDIERNTGRRVDVRNVRFDNNRGASRADRRNVSIFRPNRDNMERIRGERGNSSRNGRVDNRGNSRVENRGNARIDNNRNSRIENRNDSRTNRSNESRVNRNDRSNSDYTIKRNERGQREMHIGNSNGRNERSTVTRQPNSTRTDREAGNIRNENRSNRESNRQIQRERPTRQIGTSESRQPRSSSQERTAWDRGASSRPSRSEAAPQRMERSPRQSAPSSREQRAPQQREQRAPQQREQRAPRMQQQESRQPSRVFQASNTQRSFMERPSRSSHVERSSSNVSRESGNRSNGGSARVERGNGRGRN